MKGALIVFEINLTSFRTAHALFELGKMKQFLINAAVSSPSINEAYPTQARVKFCTQSVCECISVCVCAFIFDFDTSG